uniref:Protein phosphatase, Mg2+/Mn2+ dependent 1N (putative) n=1 Tax=Macaca nemestrina TaxID=9545 RepID=A0A2K6C7K2_MACNE
MTCILVCFPGAPRPSEEAIRRELALEAALGQLCADARSYPDIPVYLLGSWTAKERGRMALGSPPPRIWAQLWTWRPDSCCPLGTLCSTGASTELKKKTDPFPNYMYQRKEGRPM